MIDLTGLVSAFGYEEDKLQWLHRHVTKNCSCRFCYMINIQEQEAAEEAEAAAEDEASQAPPKLDPSPSATGKQGNGKFAKKSRPGFISPVIRDTLAPGPWWCAITPPPPRPSNQHHVPRVYFHEDPSENLPTYEELELGSQRGLRYTQIFGSNSVCIIQKSFNSFQMSLLQKSIWFCRHSQEPHGN